jgi:anti-sigma B factor antagonist
MSFGISYELRGAIPVIRVCGELEIATAPQLKSIVGSALSNGAESIAFDFSNLVFIDSSGLAVLMHAQKRVVARGGRIYILGAYGHTRRVFSLLNLGRIFRLCGEGDLPSEGRGDATQERPTTGGRDDRCAAPVAEDFTPSATGLGESAPAAAPAENNTGSVSV